MSVTSPHDMASEPTFGRVVVVMCSMINFGMAIGLPMSLSAMFLDWQDYFAVSRAHTAAVQSVCVGILFIGSVLPGYLMDRFGPRFTLLLGTVLATLGLIPGFFATSIDHLILTTGVISGSGFCLMQLPCYPCATMHFSKYRSLVFMMCGMGVSVCGAGLPKLIRILVDEYTWRGAYVIITGMILNTFVTGLVMTSVIPVRHLSLSADVTNMEFDICSNGSKDNEGGTNEITKYDFTGLLVGKFEEAAKDFKSYEVSLEVSSDKLVKDSEGNNSNGACSEKDLTGACLNDVAKPDSSLLGLDSEHSCKDRANSLSETFVNRHGISRNESCRDWLMHELHSRWRFLIDPVCLLLFVVGGLSLGTVVSFNILLVDFARTKGFDGETDGVLFIQVTVLSSVAGRFVAGVANLIPHLHSVYLLCCSAGVLSVALMAVGHAPQYTEIMILLAVIGVAMGSLYCMNAKAVMDLDSVDAKSYPLALGVMCMLEGINDMSLPVLIAYMVDETEAYFIPLTLFGSAGIAATLLFLVAFIIQRRRRGRLGHRGHVT